MSAAVVLGLGRSGYPIFVDVYLVPPGSWSFARSNCTLDYLKQESGACHTEHMSYNVLSYLPWVHPRVLAFQFPFPTT